MARGSDVFVPTGAETEETEEEVEPEESEEAGSGDSLLGDAFDALQDSDREGFVRLMRAAFNSMKD
jgi:hypothetical protein